MMDTVMGETKQRGVAMRLLFSRYTIPVLSVLLGLIVFIVYTVSGDWRGGVWGIGVMTGFGALVLFGGRSETIRGLRGDGRDERIAMIDTRATAFAGTVLVIAVIAAWLVEVGRGHDGSPFTWLGVISGLAYIAAIVFQRVRS